MTGGVQPTIRPLWTQPTRKRYKLLEEEVVPAFYDRDVNKVPGRWLQLVKEAIRTTMPRFSARRMVKQYAEWMYASGFSADPTL